MSVAVGRLGNTAFYAGLAAKAKIEVSPSANGQFDANTVISTIGGLAGSEVTAVRAAVAQANNAIAATPSATPNVASSGTGAASTIPAALLSASGNVFGQVDTIRNDIQALENGGMATLRWWGWQLELNENATQAFEALLTNDLPILTAALGAAIVSPPLAAALAIVKVVASSFSAEISSQDTNHTGVTITGFCFVLPAVQANPAAS